MVILVVHEDTEALKEWGMGLETLLEHCNFCNAPTPYWHKRTNSPPSSPSVKPPSLTLRRASPPSMQASQSTSA